MKQQLIFLIVAALAGIAAACPQCPPEKVLAATVEAVIFERPIDDASGTNWFHRLGEPLYASAYGASFAPLEHQAVVDAVKADPTATLHISTSTRFTPPFKQQAKITPAETLYRLPPKEADSAEENISLLLTPKVYSNHTLNALSSKLAFAHTTPANQKVVRRSSTMLDLWRKTTEVKRITLGTPVPTELFIIQTLRTTIPCDENESSLESPQ